jgi:hypothetical protein
MAIRWWYVDILDVNCSNEHYEALRRASENPTYPKSHRDVDAVREELDACFAQRAATGLIPAFSSLNDLFYRASELGNSSAKFIIIGDIERIIKHRTLKSIGSFVGYGPPFDFQEIVGVLWEDIPVRHIVYKSGTVNLATTG